MIKNAAKIQNINWNKVFDRQKEKYLAVVLNCHEKINIIFFKHL